MIKRTTIVLLCLLCLVTAGLAAAEKAPQRPLGFIEIWNNIGYFDTNVEKKGFASILGRLETKAGINLFNQPLQVYGAYYGTASQTEDYYNNSLLSGIGIRYRPLERYQGKGWQLEWIKDLKIYYEALNSSYFKNAASAESAGLNTSDIRYGLEVWHEWNLDGINPSYTWGELWGNLSFRSTNFSVTDFNSYILYLQPKIGWHLPSDVQSYVKADLTYSGQSDYYLNTLVYGGGLRFQPWRTMGKPGDLMQKFKMFVELLGVSYLKGDPPLAINKVGTDLRFGIDLSYGR
ncbi:MAG: hypothetical protein ABIE84_00920 [bacterium]